MKKLNIIRLFCLITLAACAAFEPKRNPSSYEPPDYQVIFQKARQYLITQEVSKAKLKKIPEHHFVQFLQDQPEW